MFYFIPAWYQNERPWYDNNIPWYSDGKEEFDDTISHLRMFEASRESNRLLVLAYQPQLRYFLHRYDLLEVDRWSLFDTIQGIDIFQQRPLDFRKLNWPDGVDWVYTPFAVLAYLQGKQLASVEFGAAGQLLWIDWFQLDQIEKRYVFDDRGFVSSILYYRNGREYAQDYLDARGVCQFREYLLPDHKIVEIRELATYPFQQNQYDSMEQVVEEVLATYLQEQGGPATIMLASHPQHNILVQNHRGEQLVVLSSYAPREEKAPSLLQAASCSDLVVVNRFKDKQKLFRETGIEAEHIPLFDTRLSLGKSQRLKDQIVYFLVDQLEQEVVLCYLSILFEAMRELPDMVLYLVTYNREESARVAFKEKIEQVLEDQEEAYLFLDKDNREKMILFEPWEGKESTSRIAILYLESELAIAQTMEQVRVVIDLAEEIDSYTQMSAISAGIPQVNRQQSEFVEHLKNGYYIQEAADLRKAIDYYLIGLGNWNRSLVDTVQKIEEYTSGQLVERLVSKIEENGKKDKHNSDYPSWS